MLASSWMDLVVGTDIHTHLVPAPAGPVPTRPTSPAACPKEKLELLRPQ
jgi:hypothetical protein